MKVTWGTDDIRVGRVVGKPGRGERWMIGYRATREMDDPREFTLNSLSDGMVQDPMTAAELVALLNRTGDLPVELLM